MSCFSQNSTKNIKIVKKRRTFFMQELLEQVIKRIERLEKKLEIYYSLLKVENELDFILKGTYFKDKDIEGLLTGNY